jgi:hypothetical protein
MSEAFALRKKGGVYLQVSPPAAGIPLLLVLALLAACQTGPSGTAATGSDFRPTSTGSAATISSPGLIERASAETQAGTPFDLPSPETGFPLATTSSFDSCSDNLTFMGDLTYPDRAKVLPDQLLEKRWKVRNSGSCDWGPEYRFRWVEGTPLSSQQEFALYPAVAGSEAVIGILLTAPSMPGEYISNWRAISPLGVAFGDTLYIDVVVA